jgi:hypothetical protein
MVKLTIENGASDWNGGLEGAIRNESGSALTYVKMMVENGATNLNECMDITSDINITEYLIKHGATKMDRCMEHACYLGDIDTLNLLILNGSNNWNRGLSGACVGYTYDIYNRHILDCMRCMIEKGATECHTCDRSIEDHLSLIRGTPP